MTDFNIAIYYFKEAFAAHLKAGTLNQQWFSQHVLDLAYAFNVQPKSIIAAMKK